MVTSDQLCEFSHVLAVGGVRSARLPSSVNALFTVFRYEISVRGDMCCSDNHASIVFIIDSHLVEICGRCRARDSTKPGASRMGRPATWVKMTRGR